MESDTAMTSTHLETTAIMDCLTILMLVVCNICLILTVSYYSTPPFRQYSPTTCGNELARWELFIKQWELAIREDKEVIVTGDMNIDSFKWCRDDLPSTDSTYRLRPLIDLLFEKVIPQGFSQQVRVATHAWKGQHPSCLDHLYTNKPDR